MGVKWTIGVGEVESRGSGRLFYAVPGTRLRGNPYPDRWGG